MINIEKLTPNTSKELLTILSFSDKEILDKLPEELIKKLNYLSSYSKKEFYINKNKDLIEQDLSEDCKELLGEIYNSYIDNEITLNKMLDN